MYLKSIDIHGFKSFADRTKLEFHNGITGIVGPNGSGKSNVADAVRWVLGEQKTRQLRSTKMEDIIFSGTQSRKPMGYAYVAITFDNSDHKLNLDYNEVTVSRRLYRSGESEYMINGARVRLRDVQELFYDTGIGKEGYSIIGQGQIDQILSGKPEERRELLDEAAGIVKYKRRKSEALRKLDDHNQNLIRTKDILGELEERVKPLEKESDKAQKYLLLRDELKTNDLSLVLLELDENKDKIKDLEQKTEISTNAMKKSNLEFEQIKSDYEKLEEDISKIDDGIESKKEKESALELEIEKATGDIKLFNEQINSVKDSESFISQRVESIEKERERHENEIKEDEKQKDENEALLFEASKEQEILKSEISDNAKKVSELEKEIEEDKTSIIDVINARAKIKAGMEKCDAMLEQISIREANLNQKMEDFKAKKDDRSESIAKIIEQLLEIEKEIGKVEETLNSRKERLDILRGEGEKINEDLLRNREEYHKSKSHLDELENITERYEGYGESIKRVMDLRHKKNGIIGVVADIIKTDKKYETAIETALGGNIQNIVTDTETTAKEAIEYLKKNKYGRATFLPLASMSGKTNFNAPDALDEQGVIGLASDLAKTKEEYSSVVKYLLGRVLVVDTIDHAITIARKYHYTVRMVTLEGEYLNVGGSISGGAFKNNSNLLGRRREIDETSALIKKLLNEEERLEKDLHENRASSDALTDEINRVNEELQKQRIAKNTMEVTLKQENERKENLDLEYEGYEKEKNDITEEMKNANDNGKSLEKELEGAKDKQDILEDGVVKKTKRLDELKKDLEEKKLVLDERNLTIANLSQKHEYITERVNNARESIRKLDEDLFSIGSDKDEYTKKISERTKAIEEKKSLIEKNKEELEEVRKSLVDDEQKKESIGISHKDFFDRREKLSEEIANLDKEIYRLKSQNEALSSKNEELDSYMWEEYSLTYRQAKEYVKCATGDKKTLKESVNSLKKEIKSLGEVNVNSIDEFKEVNERYSFMKKQHDDLMAAKENLSKVISELDTGMRKQFNYKFEQIKDEFNHVFVELFGGGKGTLELLGDDVLEAEIQVVAQPPGKKLQNMMQLSGGEKALTAICLLFAIQNLKPSPFCLLDEIEAALDGTNVVRFAEYLNKLKSNTQFIVITHRRGTMGCTDRLYGITMQEKGVTALVSVDLVQHALEK